MKTLTTLISQTLNLCNLVYCSLDKQRKWSISMTEMLGIQGADLVYFFIVKVLDQMMRKTCKQQAVTHIS